MADTLSADVVIVGSGAVGSLMAHRLAKARVPVLLLEGGPCLQRWQVVERYRNSFNKDDYASPYPPAPYAPHPQYSPDNHYLLQKVDAYVDRGAAVARQYYERIARLMGGTEIAIDGHYAGNNHITGTLMMGTNPADSVVDGTCRTHDHPNLFLAGTGTMPNGSTVNPTLTAVALGLRAAATIQAEL